MTEERAESPLKNNNVKLPHCAFAYTLGKQKEGNL